MLHQKIEKGDRVKVIAQREYENFNLVGKIGTVISAFSSGTGKIAIKNGDSIMERRFNALYRAVDKYLLSEDEEKELETLYNSLWDDSYDIDVVALATISCL